MVSKTLRDNTFRPTRHTVCETLRDNPVYETTRVYEAYVNRVGCHPARRANRDVDRDVDHARRACRHTARAPDTHKTSTATY